MGLTLKSNSIISSIATGFDLPVAGSVGTYLFDANSIGKNYAQNGKKPLVVGTPIRSSQFGVKFNKTNYINTGLILSALKPTAPEYTVIVVCSNNTDTAMSYPLAVSYKNSDASAIDVNGEGVGFFFANVTAFASINNGGGSYGNGNVQYGRAGFSTKSIVIPTSRYKYKDKITVSEHNSGNTASADRTTETAVTMPTKPIFIGRFQDALGGGITDANISYDTEFYGVFMFDRYLSNDEMTIMRNWIASEFLASRELSL
ncbi:MAG TPA: hypothetical protein DIC32_14540 [Acinetobacter radioresistens]|uniref:Uncharacterized protein n=1 Tax=Acinetobacter radioresistens TaxID=40216 RepID=A0A3D3G479_ACIRA|nr:hypothetical protein [Acinetobacter radioresistens]